MACCASSPPHEAGSCTHSACDVVLTAHPEPSEEQAAHQPAIEEQAAHTPPHSEHAAHTETAEERTAHAETPEKQATAPHCAAHDSPETATGARPHSAAATSATAPNAPAHHEHEAASHAKAEASHTDAPVNHAREASADLATVSHPTRAASHGPHTSPLAEPTVSRERAQHHQSPKSLAATVLNRPCPPGCVAAASSNTNQGSQRDAELSHASRPRPPSTERALSSSFDSRDPLDVLCRRCAPRGPPPALS
jgi:hypothetical protein